MGLQLHANALVEALYLMRTNLFLTEVHSPETCFYVFNKRYVQCNTLRFFSYTFLNSSASYLTQSCIYLTPKYRNYLFPLVFIAKHRKTFYALHGFFLISKKESSRRGRPNLKLIRRVSTCLSKIETLVH